MKHTASSCILTIIKNEHQYLDEWIKYHLDIGVNHIFIFEDIDSDTHSCITNKYSEKASLNNISTLLTSDEIKTARQYKEMSNKNPQHMYLKKSLLYLKENFKDIYDWCFVIDVDEFITLENKEDNLKDVLSLYFNYDAFILSWECYGANGLIEKPDYTKHGVIETFTKKMQGSVRISSKTNLTKTCYLLKNYKNEYFVNQHQPNDLCNFCRTDLSKDRYAEIYDKIFLRHYITKSWEEFYDKNTKRGFLFGGKNRDLDSFFTMNRDMLELKSTLIPYPSEYADTLIILPYKQSKAQGNELEICINAWKKFCKFKYRFVVVGQFEKDLPKKFKNIGFLRTEDLPYKEGQYNPHLDVMHKMMRAREVFGKQYAGFIWIADDNYAIKPFYLQDILKTYYHELVFNGGKDKPTSFWKHDKWKTKQLLDSQGLPHISYATHFPKYYDFNKLKEICDKYNMLEESYVIEDVYFNYFEHEEPILDNEIRVGICSKSSYENNFQKAVDNPNTKFIFNSVEGWSKELEDSLWEIINNEKEEN